MSEVQRVPDTSFWLGADGVPAHIQMSISFTAGPLLESMERMSDARRDGTDRHQRDNYSRHLTPGEPLDIDPAKERQWIDMAETAGIISEKDAWMRRLGLPSVDRWRAELAPPVDDRPIQQHYVAGFLFSEDREYVALIEKQKPAWQKGKLNAIGGKIEPNETPIGAMRREFKEEAGLRISHWKPVAVLTGEDFVVHFFAAFDDWVFNVRTMETEVVRRCRTVAALEHGDLMPNLRTLIPLALDTSGITKPVQLFDGIAEASQQRGTQS